MDQAPYRSMPTSDTAALLRENCVLRAMLRFVIATFVILCIVAFFVAMATPNLRAEVGISVLLTLIAAVWVAGRALLDVLPALAASMHAPREETGVRVDASESPASMPAAPETAAALKKAITVVREPLNYQAGFRDAIAEHQLLLAQLHEVETTGRLAAKR